MAPLAPGEKAAAFTLLGTDGNWYALSDYTNSRVLVVIFSCNHCPYVRAWEDRMIAIQQDYTCQGVHLLAINANDARRYPDDSFEKMQQRAQEKHFPFPYLFDDTQEVARAYGATRTPEVFLFDQGGILRYHGVIDDSYEDVRSVTQPYLRQAIDAVMAGKAPNIVQTSPVGCTIKWK
jgi:peroxiredoxin